jgi:hypothetical protein
MHSALKDWLQRTWSAADILCTPLVRCVTPGLKGRCRQTNLAVCDVVHDLAGICCEQDMWMCGSAYVQHCYAGCACEVVHVHVLHVTWSDPAVPMLCLQV